MYVIQTESTVCCRTTADKKATIMSNNDSITIYCTNHQCLRNHKCARYTRNHKLAGTKTVRRFDCDRNGYKYFITNGPVCGCTTDTETYKSLQSKENNHG